MFKKSILIAFFLTFSYSYAQQFQFSDDVSISVLTCETGDDLYSQFGHSAFRIKDHQNKGLDIVFNYGVFDFSAPNFYLNFVKGKLYYKLGRSWYPDFIAQYQFEKRSVYEQKLNLTTIQKKKVISFLQHNAKPENATYQYTFFYNNCATKIRDVLEDVLPSQIKFDESYLTTQYTFRGLINKNIPHNSWANTGINIALGSIIDQPATAREHQFLPSYIQSSFDNATINNIPLVESTKTVLNYSKSNSKALIFWSPYLMFTALALLILIITFYDYKRGTRNKFLDFTIHFTTGLIGCIILLMWLATYHLETKNNFNIMWAFAPNLIIGFILLRKSSKKWIVKYYELLLILLSSVFIFWMLNVEVFSRSLIPLLIALMIRYLYVKRFLSAFHKT